MICRLCGNSFLLFGFRVREDNNHMFRSVPICSKCYDEFTKIDHGNHTNFEQWYTFEKIKKIFVKEEERRNAEIALAAKVNCDICNQNLYGDAIVCYMIGKSKYYDAKICINCFKKSRCSYDYYYKKTDHFSTYKYDFYSITLEKLKEDIEKTEKNRLRWEREIMFAKNRKAVEQMEKEDREKRDKWLQARTYDWEEEGNRLQAIRDTQIDFENQGLKEENVNMDDIIFVREDEYGKNLSEQIKKYSWECMKDYLLNRYTFNEKEERLKTNVSKKIELERQLIDKKNGRLIYVYTEKNKEFNEVYTVNIMYDMMGIYIKNGSLQIEKKPCVYGEIRPIRCYDGGYYSTNDKIPSFAFPILKSHIMNSIKTINHSLSDGKYEFDFLEGHEFENYCSEVLKKNGYEEVIVTQEAGDYGIDITAYKDGIKYGIQCKRYTSSIGVSAIQQAYSGSAFYDCDKAAIMTNQFLSDAARKMAEKMDVLVIDREKLIAMVKKD